MNDYTSDDLAKLLNFSGQAIRYWTQEFQHYLSEGTRPKKGRHRRYNLSDLEVLTLVAHMRKQQRASWEDIHTSLKRGERGVPANDPAAWNPQAIASLQTRNRELETLLTSERSRADRAQGERDALKHALDEAQQEIIRLHIQLAKQGSE